VAFRVPDPVLPDIHDLFKGFADPTRIRILNLLTAGELCVCDITDILALPQSTVSRHLSYLLRVGLVEVARQWKFSHYQLAEPSNPVHKNLLKCAHTCFTDVTSLDKERERAVKRVREREADPC
jgi:ArsR family transcriptional regulator